MSLSLLLVEDNARTREQILEMLSKSAYKVTVATDGLDGLDTAKHQRFDAVLIDHKMPLMDGLKLIQNLREHEDYERAPLILMTTSDPKSVEFRAQQAGADVVLGKPLDEMRLQQEISQLVPKVVA